MRTRAFSCLLALIGVACASTDPSSSPADDSDPAAVAGSIGRCAEFESLPGHRVCLLDKPQGVIPAIQALRAEQVSLPDAVDHRARIDRCSPAGNQGLCGWCVAFASTAAVATLACDTLPDGAGLSEPSLWSQGGGRVEDCEGGWNLQAAARTWQTRWILSAPEWPFSRRASPPADVVGCGVARTLKWASVGRGDVAGLKAALAQDLNVVYGVAVINGSGWSAQDASYADGTISMPAAPPGAAGYHAILVVGYDDAEEVFIFRNSWGVAWGTRGYGKLPYGYIELYGTGGMAPMSARIASAGDLLARECCASGTEFCEGECCETGKCHDGVCTGCTDACITPPATYCADADTVVASSSGFCDAAKGACVYDERRTSCQDVAPTYTCQRGECLEACALECTPPARCEGGACVEDALSGFYVRIPAGTFTMGAPPSERSDAASQGGLGNGGWWSSNNVSDPTAERQHRVAITRPFWLKSTEVTQGEWRAVMGTSPSYFSACGDHCPVESVTWDDAVAYVNALSRHDLLQECYLGQPGSWQAPDLLRCEGYRLPTEAEWEYAARAGTYGPFGAAGVTMGEVGWSRESSGGQIHPVGLKQGNPWDLFDMHGNVWEWVHDGFSHYPLGYTVNPTGPLDAPVRMFRGGSWDREASYARAAVRAAELPVFKSASLGLRPARTILSAPELEVCSDNTGTCTPGCDANSDNDCPVVCGNGVVELGETCDDGNTADGDRCSSTCAIEPLVSIAVTPARLVLTVGTRVQLSATGTYRGGSTADLTASVDWFSSSPAVLVNPGGLVIPVSASQGTAVISAMDRATGVSSTHSQASATVLVLASSLVSISVTPTSTTVPPGVDVQFRATGHLGDGTSSDLTALVSWTSSSPSVAEVGNSGNLQGVATALAPSTTNIAALEPGSGVSSAGAGGALTVASGAPLASLAVSPGTLVVMEGRTRPLVAFGTYSDRRRFPMTNGVTWTSSDPSHAAVSNTRGARGVVTGVLEGATVVSVRHAASGVTSDASDQSAQVIVSAASGGVCTSTRDCSDAEACGRAVPSTDSVETRCAPTHPAPPALPIGAACLSGDECREGLCFPGITGACSVFCDDASLDCPADYACTGYSVNPGPTWLFMCSRLCEDTDGCAGAPPESICRPRVYERAGAWRVDAVCGPPPGTSPLGSVCLGAGDCGTGLCLATKSSSCGDDRDCQAYEACECEDGSPPPCADPRPALCVSRNCSALCNDDGDCSVPGQPLSVCRSDIELKLPDGSAEPLMACGRGG